MAPGLRLRGLSALALGPGLLVLGLTLGSGLALALGPDPCSLPLSLALGPGCGPGLVEPYEALKGFPISPFKVFP